jgi:Ni,Fe-hydrogenase maturation factor
MQTLLIATGDERRGDEAATGRVLELVGSDPNVRTRRISQFGDSLAEEIGEAESVMFIDPAHELGDPWMEPAGGETGSTSLLSLARSAYQFRGQAYVCHVPGLDFSEGAELSPYAEQRARQAAALIRRFLSA